jgi:glycerophosphoryl diester phosphodiesterase
MEYIAHRGKTQEALENTTKAFEHAGQDDHFVGIECDIHSTLDGVFVVHHDDSIKNLNNDNRKIIDMNFHEIKDIKLEGKYDIPTLETFLEICKTYKKIPMIEIKKVANIEHLNQLLILLDLYKDIKPIIISFNINYLKYLRAISDIELYFLTTEITDQNMYDCRVNELNYYINKESLNGQTIKVLKSKGFKIGVFTVNEKEIEEQAKKLSLNYLTTDSL